MSKRKAPDRPRGRVTAKGERASAAAERSAAAWRSLHAAGAGEAERAEYDAASAALLENVEGFLVRFVSWYAAPAEPCFDDALQAARLACVLSSRTYDRKLGAFLTYTTLLVRREVFNAVRVDRSMVRRPMRRGRYAEPIPVARLHGAVVQAASPAPEQGRHHVAAERMAALSRLADLLPERDREVFFSRHGINGPSRTFREVAAEFGFSLSRAGQIEERARRRLAELARREEIA